MGNTVSSSGPQPQFVQLKVKENGSSAKLEINKAGEWKWNYDVRARNDAENEALHALLERKMQAKMAGDPRFASIPPDRLKLHFAKFNQQFDSQGQVMHVRPPREVYK
jgi:hypothetical protein